MSGYYINNGATDLTTLFKAGDSSSSITTNYRDVNGNDLSKRFKARGASTTTVPNTGYSINNGATDLNALFMDKNFVELSVTGGTIQTNGSYSYMLIDTDSSVNFTTSQQYVINYAIVGGGGGGGSSGWGFYYNASNSNSPGGGGSGANLVYGTKSINNNDVINITIGKGAEKSATNQNGGGGAGPGNGGNSGVATTLLYNNASLASAQGGVGGYGGDGLGDDEYSGIYRRANSNKDNSTGGNILLGGYGGNFSYGYPESGNGYRGYRGGDAEAVSGDSGGVFKYAETKTLIWGGGGGGGSSERYQWREGGSGGGGGGGAGGGGAGGAATGYGAGGGGGGAGTPNGYGVNAGYVGKSGVTILWWVTPN